MELVAPYKVGFCPQCGVKIMVKNAQGIWNTLKPNYRQAEISFPDGHRVRTIICKDCLVKPDLDKLMQAICQPGSRAATAPVVEELSKKVEKMKPKGIAEFDHRRPTKGPKAEKPKMRRGKKEK